MSKLTEARKLFEEVAASDMTPPAVQGVIPPPTSPDQSGDAQALDLLTDIRDLMGELVTAEKDEVAAEQGENEPDGDDKEDDFSDDVELDDVPDDAEDEDSAPESDAAIEDRSRGTKTTMSMPR